MTPPSKSISEKVKALQAIFQPPERAYRNSNFGTLFFYFVKPFLLDQKQLRNLLDLKPHFKNLFRGYFGALSGPSEGPLRIQILVIYLLHSRALLTDPETAKKPLLTTSSRSNA